MESSLKSLDPRTLARLHGLRLRARRIVEGTYAGLHRSPHRGFSVEFAEHREYTPGDDLRYLDWKVFGRTDKFYLKQFEDETNLVCYLVLDVSESMAFRGPDAAMSKWEYAQCLAAALAWLVLESRDAVGLVTFDTAVRSYLRPSTSPTRLKELLETVESTSPTNKTSLASSLNEVAGRLSKRGVVIVISDLLNEVDETLLGLRQLVHYGHDVAVLHLLDPAERAFPFERPTRFRGLEGLPEMSADARTVRAAYLRELDRYLRQLARGCADNGVDYHLVSTTDPFDTVLKTFFASRVS